MSWYSIARPGGIVRGLDEGSGIPVVFQHGLGADDFETVTKALAGAARSSAETIVEVPDNFSCLSAHTLAAFTGDTVDGTALGKLDPVQVTGGDPDIVVSPVSGKSFSVTCQLEPS